MVQIYSYETLVRFLYKETSIVEHFEVQDAIENDPELKNRFSLLHKAFKALPKVRFNASTYSIDKILKYSKNSQLEAFC